MAQKRTTKSTPKAGTTTNNSASSKKSTTKKTAASRSGKPKVSEDKIRSRAFEIHLERMKSGKHGDHITDWHQAEKELNGAK
jgi:hypothetical protein